MFKSVWRLFKALGYLVTGRINKARHALMSNPAVIRETMNAIVEDKKNKIAEYSEAVAQMQARREEKTDKLKRLYNKQTEAEKKKQGAFVKTQAATKKYDSIADQNARVIAVKADPEYLRCKKAYDDYTNELKSIATDIKDTEDAVKKNEENINRHRTNIEGLVRELKKIKDESSEMVADVISAKEEEKAAALLSGLSQDNHDQELDEMRQFSRTAKARAAQARELAGLSTMDSDQEFLNAAESSASDDEFDKLLGLTKETPVAVVEEPAERAKLPEA